MKHTLAVVLFILISGVSGLAQGVSQTGPADDVGVFTKLRFATILVRDYDEAIKWYTEVLGFEKIRDQAFGAGHRWVVVAPKEQKEIGIVLAVSRKLTRDDKTIDYMDRLGKETNWVFQSNDVRKLYQRLTSRGVKFIEPPVEQPWGAVQAVFEDLYGNIFVVESPLRRPGPAAPAAKPNVVSNSNFEPVMSQTASQGDAEMQRLKFREGVWDVTMEFQPAPTSEKMIAKGVQINKLNGRWLLSDLEANLGGRPFVGHGINGFDSTKGKFVGVWVDSMRTYLTPVEGSYDSSGKKFTTTSMERDAKGQSLPVTSVTETIDNNTEVMTLVATSDNGEKYTRIKITYSRRK